MDNCTNAENPQAGKNSGFVKMLRSDDIHELIEASPLAFTLAAVIALRARFKAGKSLKGLHQGECFLGDHARYGMTQRGYRTAKQQLSKWGFATFKATNKGTVARLLDSRVFDVLNEQGDKQSDKQATSKRLLTKNGKKAENGKNETDSRKARAAAKFSERKQPAAEIVFGFADAAGIPRDVAARFLRYNGRRGWPVENWQGALHGFAGACEETGTGAVDMRI